VGVQAEESPPGGQERECSFKHMKHILLYNQKSPLMVRRENAALNT